MGREGMGSAGMDPGGQSGCHPGRGLLGLLVPGESLVMARGVGGGGATFRLRSRLNPAGLVTIPAAGAGCPRGHPARAGWSAGLGANRARLC